MNIGAKLLILVLVLTAATLPTDHDMAASSTRSINVIATAGNGQGTMSGGSSVGTM